MGIRGVDGGIWPKNVLKETSEVKIENLHIIMQLSKASLLGERYTVFFENGESDKISQRDALTALNMFHSQIKPNQKLWMQNKLGSTKKSFYDTINRKVIL